MLPQEYIMPEYDVVRDQTKCIQCRVCERQCANEVHHYDADSGLMTSDSTSCVDCQRCVCMCPTHALKIEKNKNDYRENDNWSSQTINELYKQANSGGALLSSMGNTKKYPIYWDKILINASQVTNPSIDPLREPMMHYKPTKYRADFLANSVIRYIRYVQNQVYANYLRCRPNTLFLPEASFSSRREKRLSIFSIRSESI